MSEQLVKVPVNMLVYSRRNPRYEMRRLEELASNIEQYGVLQPIIIRPKKDKFEVVVGERRLRAAIMAGFREVPAIIREVTDREADELRLIENIHRDDLTDAEKGDAVYALIEGYPERYRSVADVARAINVSYNTVWNQWCAKSRKLSERVRELISGDELEESQGRLLMKYDHSTQDRLASALVKHKLTKRQTVEFLKRFDANPKADLDELANETKGVRKVEVEVAKLPPEVKEEVERVIKEKEKEVKMIRKEALEKAREAPRKPKPKPKPIQVRLPVPPPAEAMPAGAVKPKLMPELKLIPLEAEVPPAPAEIKPKPIEEELRELLGSSIERLKTEPFAVREEAFKRIIRVLEEPILAKEERKMVKEIDTGISEECPICHKKLRIIHYEPPDGHKCEEVSE